MDHHRNRDLLCALPLIFTMCTAMSEPPTGLKQPVTTAASTGAISSTGQSGQAITAGSIGAVTQIMPTLVQGPLLDHFKKLFARGVVLRLRINTVENDAQLQSLASDINSWSDETQNWLKSQFGEYAWARFVWYEPSAMIWTWNGQSDVHNKMRENCLKYMAGVLPNLDMLMREPSLYDQKAP